MSNTFNEKICATIMANFSIKIVKKDNTYIRLHFWDIPGQDYNIILASIYCRDSEGIIFCWKVKNKKSKDGILL